MSTTARDSPQASPNMSEANPNPSARATTDTSSSTPANNQQHPHASIDHEEDGQAPSTGAHMNMPPPGPRPGSVQRLLEKEGHDARNVVSWLVPNRTGAGGGLVFDARTCGGGIGRGHRGERESREASRERDHGR